MQIIPSEEEKKRLRAIWDDQYPLKAPPVDFTQENYPLSWAQEEPCGPEDLAQVFKELLGWPDWVRLFTKPSLAVVAVARQAKEAGRSSGVRWISPGSGAPFEPVQGPPGIGVLKVDWAPNRASTMACEEAIREDGLVYVLDETGTAFRLGPGGARQRYGLDPDLALYGPALAGGLAFAALAGKGDPPPRAAQQPGSEALAAAAGILPRAVDHELAQRLEALGRKLLVGHRGFSAVAGVAGLVSLGGSCPMLRLDGKRAWAFSQLCREEGLILRPTFMLPLDFSEAMIEDLVWPRLARAYARLKVLPDGDKAPHGWKEAAAIGGCPGSRGITTGLEE